MGFKIQIRLHDRKQKAHQTACHGVSIEEHMSFLYREDKDATAEEKFFFQLVLFSCLPGICFSNYIFPFKFLHQF